MSRNSFRCTLEIWIVASIFSTKELIQTLNVSMMRILKSLTLFSNEYPHIALGFECSSILKGNTSEQIFGFLEQYSSVWEHAVGVSAVHFWTVENWHINF